VSAHEFAVATRALQMRDFGDLAEYPNAGHLLVPPAPSVTALCRLLTRAASGARGLAARGARLEFAYDAVRNRATCELASPRGALSLALSPAALLVRLGFGAVGQVLRAAPEATAMVGPAPVTWWEPAAVAPGVYSARGPAPPARAPRQLEHEVEAALNTLLFPVPERIADGAETAYFLVFVDPGGRSCSVPVPPGRYDPPALCALLARGMTDAAAATAPGAVFHASYDEGGKRYTFACEERLADGRSRPVRFGLAFDHPMQFHPDCLGFDAVAYDGAAAYTSPAPAPFAYAPRAAGRSPLRNTYRVSERPAERRLRVHAAPPPPVLGVVEATDAGDGVVTLRTYAARLPCAHGFRGGDVVRVALAQPSQVLRWTDGVADIPAGGARAGDDGDDGARAPAAGGWTVADVAPCPLSAPAGATARAAPRTGLVLPVVVDAPTTLRLRVADDVLRALTSVGKGVTLSADVAPFSLCVSRSLPRCIPASTLGFREGATQWGIDGEATAAHVGARSLARHPPPFVAPSGYCVEHPDYVLMHLDEVKRGTLVQHVTGGSSTSPFTKIVLYPTFREERSIPRDTLLTSGQALTRLRVRFTNPDNSPYRMHGVPFSFTLNVVKEAA
jgi:hypothetical protein